MLATQHAFWRPLWLSKQAYRDIALACVFLNILGISLPIFTRVIYDRVIPNFAEATLWVLLSGMILVIVFEVLFKISRSFITDHYGNLAAAGLEQELQQHLLHLPHGFNVAKTSQYFIHLQDIRDFFCQKLVPTLIDTPFVLTYLLVITLICPAMAIVPLIIGGAIIGVQYGFHVALHKGLLSNQKAMYAKQNALVETINGRETIRQLACYQPFTDEWKHVTNESAASQSNLAFWQGMVAHICNAAIILNSVLLVVVGVYQIHANNLSVGGLLAISLLSTRTLSPLTSIGSVMAKWPHILTEMHSIENLLALPVELKPDAEAFVFKGSITLQQATVQYSGHPLPALKDISFHLPKGHKLAVIGPSGAGKSTLLKALSAQVPLSGGNIRWDESNAEHLSPGVLREQIGIVDQYPYFFARSLRENLLLGIEREEAEIRHVLEIVGMDGFIKAMGAGLDIPIAEGGTNLSGGQRQCFAIARALLRRAPVMLMDEPTSMMDHPMEARLAHNLSIALKDKTVVLVTHRTPLLALAESVIVMDNGKIARQGKRSEIIKELSSNAT